MLDYVVSKIHEQGPREEQQDTLGMVKIGQSIRFVVVDGMGGTQSGKEAAELVLAGFREHGPLELVAKKVHASFQSWLDEEFPEVDVHELPGAVGTVLEINLSTGEGEIYHLGDTRLYIGTNQGFEQVTKDHVDSSGKVIQDFGLKGINPFIQPISVGANIQFLLCTDGLYNALDDNDTLDISMFFKEEDVELIAIALVEERSANFTDNASGYIIRTLEKQPVVTVTSERPQINVWKYVAVGLFSGLLVSLLWSDCSTNTASSNLGIPEGPQTVEHVNPPKSTESNPATTKSEQPSQEKDSTNRVQQENHHSRNVNRALQNSTRKDQGTDSESE